MKPETKELAQNVIDWVNALKKYFDTKLTLQWKERQNIRCYVESIKELASEAEVCLSRSREDNNYDLERAAWCVEQIQARVKDLNWYKQPQLK